MYGKQQSFNRGVQQVFLDYFTSLLRDYSLYIFKSANDDILFDKVGQCSLPSELCAGSSGCDEDGRNLTCKHALIEE